MHLKIYNTWRKSKDVFNKPILKISFMKTSSLDKSIKPELPKSIGILSKDVQYDFKPTGIFLTRIPISIFRIFKYCIVLSLHAPGDNSVFISDIGYWEGILNYIYNSRILKAAINKSGTSNIYINNEIITYFNIRPEYIRENRLTEYYFATTSIKNKRKQGIF